MHLAVTSTIRVRHLELQILELLRDAPVRVRQLLIRQAEPTATRWAIAQQKYKHALSLFVAGVISGHDLAQNILQPRQFSFLLLDCRAVLHVSGSEDREIVLQFLRVELVRRTHLFQLLLKFLHITLKTNLRSKLRQLLATSEQSTDLEGRVILSVMQAQCSQGILLLLNASLALLHVPLFHLGKQFKKLLNLRAVLVQQLPPLL
jgi:hypothetical protein